MSKGTFFTGQPIFNQVLSLVNRRTVSSISQELNADRYYKSFKTFDHLVTMLYAIFNQCTCLREVTTGLLAWEQRITHLGINSYPRRSTISDANNTRSAEVFERIYMSLLDNFRYLLPDSRKKSKRDNVYIFDSTTITLFHDVLTGAGRTPIDGRKKGGIKSHMLLHVASDTPVMVRFSASAANDTNFLKEVQLPKGSVVIFDKGYRQYSSYNSLNDGGVTWVTRHRDSSVYRVVKKRDVNDYQKSKGIKADRHIVLGHTHHKNAIKVQARMIDYRDPVSGQLFQFITNNFELAPLTIANYYKQRWQIETFFKRIKQNYPLKYFLGESENAIKIQIWCALIADLLIRVIKCGTKSKMAFSNIIGLVRLHLMTYMDLVQFLNHPEKALLNQLKQRQQTKEELLLFPP